MPRIRAGARSTSCETRMRLSGVRHLGDVRAALVRGVRLAGVTRAVCGVRVTVLKQKQLSEMLF